MKKLCFALAIAAIAIGAVIFQRHASAIIDWINTLGMFTPIFFLLLYGVATILFFPTMPLTLAGGILFGPILGIAINLAGATLGAMGAFCISRYLACNGFKSKSSYIKAMIEGVENRGWQSVALLRLLPVIPFNMVNYGLGVTNIKLSHYLITTVIFLIPAEVIFTYCGYAGMSILTHPQELYNKGNLFFLLVLSGVGATYLVARCYKRYRLVLT